MLHTKLVADPNEDSENRRQDVQATSSPQTTTKAERRAAQDWQEEMKTKPSQQPKTGAKK